MNNLIQNSFKNFIKNVCLGLFLIIFLFGGMFFASQIFNLDEFNNNDMVENINNNVLFAENALEKSYLNRNWINLLISKNADYKQSNIKTIVFTNNKPTGGTSVIVGATDATSSSVWSESSQTNNIEAFVFNNNEDNTKYDVIFYSESKIYLPEDCNNLFGSLENCTSIKFNNYVDSSESKTFSAMFYNDKLLTEIDFSDFKTSNVTNMSMMFMFCTNITNIDLTSFDTSNVESFNMMFASCNSLINVNLSSFNTEKITDITGMFYNCNNLETVDLSSFNLASLKKINNVRNFFTGDNVLKTIKLPQNIQNEIVINLPKDNFYDMDTLTGPYNQINFDVKSSETNTIILKIGYVVSFEANGGIVDSTKLIVTYDGKYKNLPTPTKDGYSFNGWYFDNNTFANKVENTTNISQLSNHTIYAKWSINRYTITYDVNGGSKISNLFYTIETDVTLSYSPSKLGHKFVGWQLISEVENWEAKKYLASENIGIGKYGNITLVALWSESKYNITYELNGGINKNTNPTTYSFSETKQTLEIENPTKEGCFFNGWTSNNETTLNDNILTIKENTTGEIKLTAKWLKIINTIPTGKTLIYNGCEQQGVDDGEGYTLSGHKKTNQGNYTATISVKEGYCYSDGTSNSSTITWVISKKDLSVKAKNQTIIYGLTISKTVENVELVGLINNHNLSAITLNQSTTDLTSCGQITISNAVITDEKNNDVTKNYNINYIQGVLVINKCKKTLSIEYNFKNETKAYETYTEQIYYTDTYNITSPEITGYTADKLSVSGIMPSEDITIIVTYNPNTYTLTFDTNGGEINSTSKTVTYKENYGTLPTPSKNGYTFVGWFLDNNSFETEIETTSIVETIGDHKLYAKWQKVAFIALTDSGKIVFAVILSLLGISFVAIIILAYNLHKKRGIPPQNRYWNDNSKNK